MHAMIITLFTALLAVSTPSFAEIITGNSLKRMQEFHILQAEAKINKNQLEHAWGDLAYIVCKVPNHHLALKYMLLLAKQIDKTDELKQYIHNAMQKFPEDGELKTLQSKVEKLLIEQNDNTATIQQ